jgi:hypothetical protein
MCLLLRLTEYPVDPGLKVGWLAIQQVLKGVNTEVFTVPTETPH